MNYQQKQLLMILISAVLVLVLPFWINIGLEALVIIPVICYLTKGIGSEIGAHRLWSHYGFTASTLVKRCLIILDTLAGEGSIIAFVGIHRLHHKYSDTIDDPHWYKHGLVKVVLYQHKVEKFTGTVVKDLFSDSWLVFQHRHYFTIQALIFILLAVVSPTALWYYSVNVFASMWINFLVNVACHRWGTNKNNLSNNSKNNYWADLFLLGVGQHNNHHNNPGSTQNCRYDVWGYIIKLIQSRSGQSLK